MKTKIVLLLLFFTTITQAQFVQSLNSNYNKTYKLKKTNKIKQGSTNLDSIKTIIIDSITIEKDKNGEKIKEIKKSIKTTTTTKENVDVSPYHTLLGITTPTIEASSALLFQNECITEIKKLTTKKNNLIAFKKTDTLKKNKHSNDYIAKETLELSGKIKDYKKARDYFGAINSLDGSPNFLRKFFPLRSIAQAQLFYLESTDGEKKVSFIKDVSYQNNFEGSNTLNTSLFTAVFPLFTRYAPLKINIASTISQNNDSIPENKIADKVAKGGLFNIGATYTLFYSNWKYYDNHAVTVYLPIETRLHMDDIKDKANLKDTFFYNEFSGSVFISFDLLQSKTDADLATLFITTKYSWFDGGSKFLEKIQENKFSLLQLNAGIKIANKFTLAVNIPLKSSSTTFLDKQSSTIALVFDTGN
jgi:hypothetical protein